MILTITELGFIVLNIFQLGGKMKLEYLKEMYDEEYSDFNPVNIQIHKYVYCDFGNIFGYKDEKLKFLIDLHQNSECNRNFYYITKNCNYFFYKTIWSFNYNPYEKNLFVIYDL